MKRLILLTWLIALGTSAAFGQMVPAKPARADTTLSAKVDSLSARIERVERSLDTLAILKSQREECLQDAHEYLDRSLTTLNTVSVIAGILVAVIAIIVTIVSVGAQRRISKFERLQFDLEKQFDAIVYQRGEFAKQQDAFSQAVVEARRELEHITTLRERTEQEIEDIREVLPKPSVTEQPSLAEKKLLEVLAEKITLLEAQGVQLSSDLHFERGMSEYYRQNYEAALASFNKVIEIDNSHRDAWHYRAIILHGMKRNEDALNAFDKVLSIDTTVAYAWLARAEILDELGRSAEALGSLREAIRLEPKVLLIVEAQTGYTFKHLRDDPEFKKIIEEGKSALSDER